LNRVPDWLGMLRQPGVIRADLMAGLTGAVVVLPQALAFATLAGMPPHYGLYCAMVPCVVAALCGSSRLMVTGPANAISLTVLALVAPLAVPESPEYVSLVITLTFMVGILQLAIGLTGIARFVERVPHSVIVGFTTGAAILIINSQVRTILGLDWPRGLTPLETLARGFAEIGAAHWPSVVVAGATVAACFLAKPWNHRMPYLLVGIIAGSLVAALLRSFTEAGAALGFVGRLPDVLPPFSLPDLSLDTVRSLLLPALVMTLLALAEAVSIAQAIAVRNRERLDGPREVVGQGLANLAGAFFSSYPASGSFNRSGVNVAAGARTPLSAVSASLFLIALVAFVGPLADALPLAAVAGVLVMVAIGLVVPREIRATLAEGRAAGIAMMLTFVLTLTVSLEWAIIVGIAAHIVLVRVWPPQPEV
jgi:SulP family sulfate permease